MTERSLPASPRLRVGYLTHLDGDDAPDVLYERSLRVAKHVEELGFDSLWVSERHFYQGRAGLPDALTWLAAAARETRGIRLGVAVIPVPLRHPVDVAERAALVDAISGGRLELGLGSGIAGAARAVFGWDDTEASQGQAPPAHVDPAHMDTDQLEREIDRLLAGGSVLEGQPEVIFPPRPGLTSHIWRGSHSEHSADLAAELGHGLLLPRARYGAPLPRGRWQRRVAERYRVAFERAWADAPSPVSGLREPRVAVSRTLYPARTVEDGLDDFTRRRTRFAPAPEHPETRAEVARQLAEGDVTYGPADALADALDRDEALAAATDLLVGLQPAVLTEEDEIDKIGALAEVIREWRATR